MTLIKSSSPYKARVYSVAKTRKYSYSVQTVHGNDIDQDREYAWQSDLNHFIFIWFNFNDDRDFKIVFCMDGSDDNMKCQLQLVGAREVGQLVYKWKKPVSLWGYSIAADHVWAPLASPLCVGS